MDNREVIVANTKTQKKYKINTNATTLGELKEAFDREDIDYSGMTFTEGISKTQLIDNATQLPHDIMYKGQPTNNLVILLTNTKKNIASGATSRTEIYQAIKDNNLQDAVKKEFGKNFTQVTTTELVLFLEKNSKSDSMEEDEVDEPEAGTSDEDIDDTDYDNDYDEVKDMEEKENDNNDILTVDDIIADARVESIGNSLFLLIALLVQAKVLNSSDIQSMTEDLSRLLNHRNAEKFSSKPIQTHNKVSSSDGSITEDDIDDMLNDLGM